MPKQANSKLFWKKWVAHNSCPHPIETLAPRNRPGDIYWLTHQQSSLYLLNYGVQKSDWASGKRS